jgi:hypothetical protein
MSLCSPKESARHFVPRSLLGFLWLDILCLHVRIKWHTRIKRHI